MPRGFRGTAFRDKDDEPSYTKIEAPEMKQSKGFLDSFMEGFRSYKPEIKSSQEKLADQILMASGNQGFTSDVAEGLTLYQQPTPQPIVIPGQAGEKGIFRMAGDALVGAGISGLVKAIPFICDSRLKVDIAPLCVSEVNDLLSECAFFVKDLNECS